MDSNSPKPAETSIGAVMAIDVLRIWLDQVGGNQRIPQALDLLAERTAADLRAGHASPALDADMLRRLYCDNHGGRVSDSPASRWLSSSAVYQWWEQRRRSLEQACREANTDLIPLLTRQPGGGRGNTTHYRLDFQPLSVMDDVPEEIESGAEPTQFAVICYQSEPAKSAWWLRPIIGTMAFRMRSWRGYLLIGIVFMETLAILALWLLVILILRGQRPVDASDLGLLLVVSAATWTWWHLMQPIIRLPTDRVTIANELFLAWSQMHGQLRLTRDAKSKVAGGWFQFVRHWGNCPICSGEVEIADGGKAFPGRLVGRCGDSPLEHVYSFDPVSLTGMHLHRQGNCP